MHDRAYKLGGIEAAILRRLADGARHNLFAYPFIEDHDKILDKFRFIGAATRLSSREFIEIEHSGDDAWITILPAGRAWLSAHSS